MPDQNRSIGQLSKLSGVKSTTIRYYESIKLLQEPGRTSGGQRVYDEASSNRLLFIRQCRDLGFPIEAIRELIDLQMTPNADCLKVDRVARHHLGEVDKRLKQLRALKKELKEMIVSCAGGEVASCAIMESITKPAHASAKISKKKIIS
mgnify:FL=1